MFWTIVGALLFVFVGLPLILAGGALLLALLVSLFEWIGKQLKSLYGLLDKISYGTLSSSVRWVKARLWHALVVAVAMCVVSCFIMWLGEMMQSVFWIEVGMTLFFLGMLVLLISL